MRRIAATSLLRGAPVFARAASRACAVVAAAAFCTLASAQTVVFTDNFEDGSVSDWTKITNYAGASDIIANSAWAYAGSFGLETFLNAPPGANSPLFVRASHGFAAPFAGDYTVHLWARSRDCDTCTISYDVLVDGVLLARRHAPFGFEEFSATLALAPGMHSLALGMHTNFAFNGHFFAAFDDVTVSTIIPEPSAVLLLAAGLGLLGFAARRRK